MRAAALALLLLAAPCAALVRIEPAAPAVGEPVQVQVFGEFGDPCFTLAATRRIDGRRVAIDVALTRVPGECPQLVASWVVIENLGPLAAGEYEIVVDTASLGPAWGRAPQHLAFSVRSEPVPPPTPYPACFGDCDGNGAVGIDEVMRLVGSALHGTAPACGVAAAVRIDAVTAAVRRAVYGCPAEVRRDFSAFTYFTTWSQPFRDTAPCPYPGDFRGFSVSRRSEGGHRFSISERRLFVADGRCPGAVGNNAVIDGQAACTQDVTPAGRMLSEAEVGALRAALAAVTTVTAPDPDCDAAEADGCAPQWFSWDMERFSDRPCSRARLAPEASRALLDLLRGFADAAAPAQDDVRR